jgi:hypothetical protein
MNVGDLIKSKHGDGPLGLVLEEYIKDVTVLLNEQHTGIRTYRVWFWDTNTVSERTTLFWRRHYDVVSISPDNVENGTV